ncbi:MAG: cobaltochelatase subunit CobN [Methanopyraceae archaeon]
MPILLVLLLLTVSTQPAGAAGAQPLQFHEPDAGVPPGEYWADPLGCPTPSFFREVVLPDSRGLLVTPPTRLAGRSYPENEALVERLEARWRELAGRPNREKIVALVYYNWPPGRESVTADGLDVFGSLVNILANLKAAGYDVRTPWDRELLEIARLEREGRWDEAARLVRRLEAELARLVWRYGINVGWWSGERLRRMYEGRAYLALIPVDAYRRWYERLPEVDRLYVEDGLPGLLYGYARLLRPPLSGRELESLRRDLEALLSEARRLLSSVGPVGVGSGDPRELQAAREGALRELSRLAEAVLEYASGRLGASELRRAFERALEAGRRLERLLGYRTGLFGWGPPPGDVMVVDGYFVVPGLRFGKVLLVPQPPRGWLWGSLESSVTYHSLLLPPPHHYLAVYLWLKRTVDVVVHVGTHGTLEWLPLRRTLLSHVDFPTVLLGDVPHVYLWCVTSGELLNVKWRTSAVVIGHLPPPPETATEFYLRTLVEALHECFHWFQSGSPGLAERLRPLILEALRVTRLYEWMGLSWEDVVRMAGTERGFERLVDRLHLYLHAMQAHGERPVPASLARSLHVYGLVTSDEVRAYVRAILFREFLRRELERRGLSLDELDRMIRDHPDRALRLLNELWGEWDRLVSHQGKLRSLYPDLYREAERIRRLVIESARLEIESLLSALSGRRIPVGPPGDPTLDPSVLPTGRLLYALDPNALPSEAAWRATEGLRPPQRPTLFLLSATDLINDRGASLAYLMRSSGLVRLDEGYGLTGSPVYAPVLVCQGLESVFARCTPGLALLKAHLACVLRASERCPPSELERLLERLRSGCRDPELRAALSRIHVDPGLLRRGLEALRRWYESLPVRVLELPDFRPDPSWYGAWAVKFLYGVQVEGLPVEEAARRAAAALYGPADYTTGVRVLAERLEPREWDLFVASLPAKLGRILLPEGPVSDPGMFELELLLVDQLVKAETDRIWGALAEDVLEFGVACLALSRAVRGACLDLLLLDPTTRELTPFHAELLREFHSLLLDRDWILSLSTPGQAAALFERVSRLLGLIAALSPVIESPGTPVEEALAGALGQLLYEVTHRLVLDREVARHLERINPYALEAITARVFHLYYRAGEALLRRTYHAQVMVWEGELKEVSRWVERARREILSRSLELFSYLSRRYGACGCFEEAANPVLRSVLSLSSPVSAFLPNPYAVGLVPARPIPAGRPGSISIHPSTAPLPSPPPVSPSPSPERGAPSPSPSPAPATSVGVGPAGRVAVRSPAVAPGSRVTLALPSRLVSSTGTVSSPWIARTDRRSIIGPVAVRLTDRPVGGGTAPSAVGRSMARGPVRISPVGSPLSRSVGLARSVSRSGSGPSRGGSTRSPAVSLSRQPSRASGSPVPVWLQRLLLLVLVGLALGVGAWSWSGRRERVGWTEGW